MYCVKLRVQLHYFAYGFPDFLGPSVLGVGEDFLSPLNIRIKKLFDHLCEGLFLGSLF